MTSDKRWLAAVWPFVRDSLPAAPARVMEIGCGPLGGFVPALRQAGYSCTGVDPRAPQEESYRQVAFENYDVPGRLDAIVACTSLHHVADLARTLDRVDAVLAPDGVLIVVEWARERLDEATARWCFGRLPEPAGEPEWLHKRHREWQESAQSWDAYFRSWAQAKGLHSWQDVLAALDARFDPLPVTDGPYFFPDLADTSAADEQSAIDAGLIKANRVQYVGRRMPGPAG